MNTIPSTFNSTVSSYTAVGGSERAASTGLSAVLLNRGGRYPRRTMFQELEKTGFDYIISIEDTERYDLEELSARFPFVRFILLKENISPGEQINLAVSEISSPLFFVLWNDLRILHSGGAGRMAERLYCTPEDVRAGNPGPNKRLCTTPVIQNSRFETLPTLIAPALDRGTVKPVFFATQREGKPTLFPFDGVGIYDRDRFIKLGGFDITLKNPHWQLMDFGFRSQLWGEDICSTQHVRLSYNAEIPLSDSTADESHRRFYLKNLAPVFHGDGAEIPFRRFFSYFPRSGKDPFLAWADFAEARSWVRTNRYRFRKDARALVEFWDTPGREPALPGIAPGVPPALPVFPAAGDPAAGQETGPAREARFT
ncbi:MAG: hypothetical protein LBI91_00030 [Spirochaetaceae bacterium]|nr:hypothetical protein [Spirochaetaceae bacterium]